MHAIFLCQYLSSHIKHLSFLENPGTEDRQKIFPTQCSCVHFCSDSLRTTDLGCIEVFSKTDLHCFSRYIDTSCGIPGHDIFRKVFSISKPENLGKIMINWTEELKN